MSRKKSTRTEKQLGAGLAAAEKELRAALAVIADQPGGVEKLNELAVRMILPIEDRVRRENPNHPTLAVLDEWRRLGKL